MIILETVIFLFISSLSVLSLNGYGKIIAPRYKKNFLEEIFFGFIVVAFIVTFLHFFININYIISLSILFFGLIYFVKTNKENLLKINYINWIVFFILIPIFLSQKYHEDFGYYHLPYILLMVEQKIIFGLANSNIAFSHNSIWLNIMSLFYLTKSNINYLTMPTFLIYLVYVIYFIKKNLESNKKSISEYFILISLFYLILKFTRLSEFGNDLPSLLFSILSIFYFIKFSEINKWSQKYFYFFCCVSFALFSVLIKLSCIPILLLPLILFFKNYKKLRNEIINVNYLFLFLLVFIFYLQQFIYTSCIIFPSSLTCINTEWFSDDFLILRENLELTNKSYYASNNLLSKEDYLSKLNWFSFWLEINYQNILENILTISLPILLFIFLLNKEKNKLSLYFENKRLFILFIFLSFAFWLKFSPVYRFSIPYFLSLFLILSLNFYMNKKFSKKIFSFLIILSLVFNFTKNIFRINDKDYISFGIEKIQNQFYIDKLSKNNFIKVYRPDIKKNKNGWQGRLCWDIPVICSYEEIRVTKNYGYLFFSNLNN